jgi:regulator of sirC expression with transglutaminase-like and TPR domain
MSAPARSVRQLFSDEVRRPDAEIELARAALLIAKEEYSQISVEQYLGRLDQMAEEVKDRLADETAPLVVLQELLDVLYQRNQFRGNKEAYYDPRNSYLNDVLEVGWRLGLPLQGVNFPHHFLVRFRGDALDLLIDPFDGGQIRFEDQAQDFLDRVYGGSVRVQDAFLREASRRDILVRMLMNLRALYVHAGDHVRATSIAERLRVIRSYSR